MLRYVCTCRQRCSFLLILKLCGSYLRWFPSSHILVEYIYSILCPIMNIAVSDTLFSESYHDTLTSCGTQEALDKMSKVAEEINTSFIKEEVFLSRLAWSYLVHCPALQCHVIITGKQWITSCHCKETIQGNKVWVAHLIRVCYSSLMFLESNYYNLSRPGVLVSKKSVV